MAIDRMDWHYGGDYPEGLPDENGGTHIGMYLTWIITNHLEGEDHQEDSQEELEAVRNRTMSGRDFLINMCDEKFIDTDLNEEGLAFTEYYYNGNNLYFSDYEKALAKDLPSLYHVENTWDNYDRIAPVISATYQKWQTSQKR